MNEEIRQMFQQLEPHHDEPLAFNSDDLVSGGRKRRRLRAVGAGIGAVVAVTALAVGVMTLPGAFADPATDGAADGATGQQPEYPFPDLDPPGEDFYYSFEPKDAKGTETEAASRYGKAYTTWFKENKDVTFTDWPGVKVFDDEIIKNNKVAETPDHISTGESLPRYRIAPSAVHNGVGENFQYEFEDRGMKDDLRLNVFPRGSYKEGPGEAFGHLVSCEDRFEAESELTVECHETTGPDGEKIIEQTSINMRKGTDTIWQKIHMVVVYRADGTAISVLDGIPGMPRGEYTPPEVSQDDAPFLSIDELTDLALSMPDAIVEG